MLKVLILSGFGKLCRRAAYIFFVLTCLLPLSMAHAAITLDQWRQQATETRKLADNYPAKAYIATQSLQDSLPVDAEPADRVRVLNLLARCEVYLAKTELAAQHAYQALEQAEQQHDRIGQVEAKINIAMIEIHRGNIKASTTAMTDGVELLQGINRPELLAEVMLRLSMSYFRLNLLDEAVTLALQNLEIAKQGDHPLALMYAYHGLGIVNERNERYQAAHNYFLKMYDAAIKAQAKRWQGQAMIGISSTARHLGDDEQAEKILLKAIALYREAGFPFNLAPALYSYANLLSKEQKYDAAGTVLEEVIGIYERYHNRIGLWFTLNAYADNLQKLNRNVEARAAIERVYRLAVDLDFPAYVSQSAERMAKIMVEKGDYQQAYQYIAKSTEMAERYARENASNRIIEVTERYKQESKQRQIDELNRQAEKQAVEIRQQELQQRLLWTVLIASTVLLAVSGWFLIKLRRSNFKLFRLNREVQLSQSKLQATLDAVPDSLFVLDKDGHYLEFHSPVMSHLLYLPAEQLLGKTVSEVLPEDMAKTCLSAISEANEQGLSMGRKIALQLADGEHWFELSVSRKTLLEGEEQQFIVLSRDITERKRMEDALLKSEQEFRALVENSPDYIVRYDNEGRRIYVNPALTRLMQIEKESFLGKTLDEWTVNNDFADYQKMLKQVIETGESGRLLLHTRTGSGQPIYGDVHFTPELDVNGEVNSVLTISRDITPLKDAEQRIEEAYSELRELTVRRDEELEEERKRIAREMHDELGQYLTTLRMNISVMRIQFGNGHRKLDEQLQTVMTLLDSTIKVVRHIASQLRPSQLQMGVSAALEWLVEDFSENTGIFCSLDTVSDDIHMEEGLAIAVFRIVQESLTNVARYAQATKVDVCLQEQEEGYYLQITDNGIGFNPDNIKKKSFGLLGMRERVTNLNGKLEINSEHGQGTMIKAYFPSEMMVEVS